MNSQYAAESHQETTSWGNGCVGHSRIIDELAINDIAAILFLLCGFREIGGKSVDSRREYG